MKSFYLSVIVYGLLTGSTVFAGTPSNAKDADLSSANGGRNLSSEAIEQKSPPKDDEEDSRPPAVFHHTGGLENRH